MNPILKKMIREVINETLINEGTRGFNSAIAQQVKSTPAKRVKLSPEELQAAMTRFNTAKTDRPIDYKPGDKIGEMVGDPARHPKFTYGMDEAGEDPIHTAKVAYFNAVNTHGEKSQQAKDADGAYLDALKVRNTTKSVQETLDKDGNVVNPDNKRIYARDMSHDERMEYIKNRREQDSKPATPVKKTDDVKESIAW